MAFTADEDAGMEADTDQSTVDHLVEALGGTTEVAAFLGVVPTAVSNARAHNRIPEAWKYRLAKLCKERRVKGYDEVFDAPFTLARPKRESAET